MANTIYDICVKLSKVLTADFRERLLNTGVARTTQSVSDNVYIKRTLLSAEIDNEIEKVTKELSDLIAAKELIRN